MSKRPHGTASRYDTGCRCSACIIADALEDEQAKAHRDASANKGRTRGVPPSRVRYERLPTGELAVECWCRAAVVYVRPKVIAARQTDTCGRPGCHPGGHR